MNILITGISGRIGANLAKAFDIFRMIDEGVALRQGRPVDVVPTYAAGRS